MKDRGNTPPYLKKGKEEKDGEKEEVVSPKIEAFKDEVQEYTKPENLDPHLVVRELYHRYNRQLQRWADYRNLFLFLAFCGLFLGVLYAQRSAQEAYKVYNTIESVVAPESEMMSSTDDVYSWLQNLLQTVWKDPVCGDGICETPFEFASYGRFGCRADCGMLAQVQHLTTIQVDLYFDFSHPLGSVAPSDLMDQASWNLCPEKTAFSGDCYFDQDQQFDKISGQVSVAVSDAPDGQWDLVVKRDIFNKVRGAVRDVGRLRNAGLYQKVFVAALAAQAERNFEISLLQNAINVTSTGLLDYMWIDWQTVKAAKDAFDMQQLFNGTCLCTNGTDVLNNTAGFTDPATYLATNCSGITDLYMKQFNNVTNQTDQIPAPNRTELCGLIVGNLTKGRTNMTQFVQKALVDRRLGDSRVTGKIAQRNSVVQNLQKFVKNWYPELDTIMFGGYLGNDPIGDPASCSVNTLAQMYVDGPTYTVTPAPANLELSRRRVYDAAMTFSVLNQRARNRVAEINFIAAEVAAINMRGPLGNITIGELMANYLAAGASSSFLPDQNDTRITPLNFTYNVAVWQGNTTAYMQCGLESRAPQYLGQCMPIKVGCISTTNDTTPYNCTDLATNTSIPGNLSVIAYRENCELPCDLQVDCNAVCECFGTCGRNEVCVCRECAAFSDDANEDTEFVSIFSGASTSGASAAVIADLNAGGRKRRRLLQTNGTESSVNLTTVLGQLGEVKTQQVSLGGQMTALQTQVEKANQLAVARNQDTRVLDLVAASRADIASGQAAMLNRLDTLLQKQAAALEAANQAAKALAAIQDLQTQQTKALQNLEKAVQNQLYAIKVAASQNVISVGQALLLWKRARRDRAMASKVSVLANIPCNNAPTSNNLFALENGNDDEWDTSRDRSIGLNNRVIGGMLITTWRTKDAGCANSKFSAIQGLCTGAASLTPFGVDPVFKRGTTSYNPDLDDYEGTIIAKYYNCSEIAEPIYNLTNPATNMTHNEPPFCAQLYNPQDLPWAFHHFPMEGRPQGFPVWFDINLDANDAQTWFTWMEEGLFLDQHTAGMSAELITYNAELRIFGSTRVIFDFELSGSIKTSYSLYTLRVELYNSPEDSIRQVFEIILTMAIFIQLLVQVFQIIMAKIEQGSYLAFFASGWSLIDLVSNGLLAVCISLWWILVEQLTKSYTIDLRYDVYQDLTPDARYTRLTGNGEELRAAVSAFNRLESIINSLNWYYALSGINILILIARVLKRLDFQPRLGVVTRSLARAGPDLLHFAVVFSMVFIGYSLMGHLIFGSSIQAFQDLATSVNTCFEMLLGNIDVNTELRTLDGLQGAAGVLFFWSYMLLVFMVLLNFLLAIIVDAFSEVKEGTNENVGLHTELARLVAAKWRALAGRLGKGHISDHRLGLLLRSWAGEGEKKEEEEAAAAAAAAAAQKNKLKLLGYELDEEAIKDVLLACLDVPAGPAAATPTPSEGGKEGGDVDTDSKVASAAKRAGTEAEVAAAAHMVLRRLADAQGDVQDVEETEEEKAAREASEAQAAALEAEREQLALALERLADVQRELAEGQRALMASQRQLQEQQGRMLGAMAQAPPSPTTSQ